MKRLTRGILGTDAALAVLAPAVDARIVNCPINGRPYSTIHGYYVDVPNTRYYVKPSQRRISRPRRRSTIRRRLSTVRGRFGSASTRFGRF